jgi:hypothetical protein
MNILVFLTKKVDFRSNIIFPLFLGSLQTWVWIRMQGYMKRNHNSFSSGFDWINGSGLGIWIQEIQKSFQNKEKREKFNDLQAL